MFSKSQVFPKDQVAEFNRLLDELKKSPDKAGCNFIAKLTDILNELEHYTSHRTQVASMRSELQSVVSTHILGSLTDRTPSDRIVVCFDILAATFEGEAREREAVKLLMRGLTNTSYGRLRLSATFELLAKLRRDLQADYYHAETKNISVAYTVFTHSNFLSSDEKLLLADDFNRFKNRIIFKANELFKYRVYLKPVAERVITMLMDLGLTDELHKLLLIYMSGLKKYNDTTLETQNCVFDLIRIIQLLTATEQAYPQFVSTIETAQKELLTFFKNYTNGYLNHTLSNPSQRVNNHSDDDQNTSIANTSYIASAFLASFKPDSAQYESAVDLVVELFRGKFVRKIRSNNEYSTPLNRLLSTLQKNLEASTNLVQINELIQQALTELGKVNFNFSTDRLSGRLGRLVETMRESFNEIDGLIKKHPQLNTGREQGARVAANSSSSTSYTNSSSSVNASSSSSSSSTLSISSVPDPLTSHVTYPTLSSSTTTTTIRLYPDLSADTAPSAPPLDSDEPEVNQASPEFNGITHLLDKLKTLGAREEALQDADKDFECPISHELMTNPWIFSDKATYDLASAKNVAKSPLRHTDFSPVIENMDRRKAIMAYLEVKIKQQEEKLEREKNTTTTSSTMTTMSSPESAQQLAQASATLRSRSRNGSDSPVFAPSYPSAPSEEPSVSSESNPASERKQPQLA